MFQTKETLIKSCAHIVLSDFLSVSSKNRRNTDVLRGFFGLTDGKYANKMCKVIYSVFPSYSLPNQNGWAVFCRILHFSQLLIVEFSYFIYAKKMI